MPDAPTGHWYWCLSHQRVEEEDSGCANSDRLGPYPSPEAAANWKATAEARNEEWDREDAEE